MHGIKIACPTGEPRLYHAAEILRGAGAQVIFTDNAATEPTCHGVILPIPSLRYITNEPESAQRLLSHLHEGGTVFAYCADELSLLPMLSPYRIVDYSADEDFLTINTTASCEGALCLLIQSTDVTLRCAHILITGWGRLAKGLFFMLRSLGANITVAARDPRARGEVLSLGAEAIDIRDVGRGVCDADIIINTVPHRIMPRKALPLDISKKVFLELASMPYGFDPNELSAEGALCIEAPSLPSRFAPRSSGLALGRALCRLCSEGNIL